ncbi:hypothetical protein MKZ38_000046 [Zalerion maritima]|uniref:ENTH domain-containing protein n=1 Tax=Zalerion maritima TaxID=339359 RepID=A0AAD5WTZ5_9PEZI|nr:hypothetical protein MKZ38_000046 [Zalerion maritima]
MDLNSLKDMATNLTLYDVKAGCREAVMNYTEMEAKVREATNNEPWGASSTLMQEIANGTFNYQTLNEIMPMIYRRFTEKTAEEWRQIYKALQLLEFLIKHGSERVIDDARSHITLLKMLRQFHFIDQNGKDQGINVRNRAKELAELLSDVDRIRSERKKARASRGKYTGVEGGASFGGGSSSRYGGFGSDSAGYGGGTANYGDFSGGQVYGDGGGFGGQETDFRPSGSNHDKFEEYDEYDEAPAAPSRARGERTAPKKAAAAPPPKKKEPEVDLFSFDDSAPTPAAAPAAASSSAGNGLAVLTSPAPAGGAAAADDDDFDDFQSAPVAQPASAFSPPMMTSAAASTTASLAAPQPVSAPKQANLTSMVGLSSISPAPSSTSTPGVNYAAFNIPSATPSAPAPLPAQASKPSGYQPSGPNYFTSVQAGAPQSSGPATSSTSASLKPALSGSKPPTGGGDAFGSLWSSASTGIKKPSTPSSGPAMGQLAKEKSSAGIWGAPSSTPAAGSFASKPAAGSSGLDDLLG